MVRKGNIIVVKDKAGITSQGVCQMDGYMVTCSHCLAKLCVCVGGGLLLLDDGKNFI